MQAAKRLPRTSYSSDNLNLSDFFMREILRSPSLYGEPLRRTSPVCAAAQAQKGLTPVGKWRLVSERGVGECGGARHSPRGAKVSEIG